MMFLTIDESKKITGMYEGDPNTVTLEAGERFQEVPDDCDGGEGNYEDEFDDIWRLRPLEDRVADGTARDFPANMVVREDGEVRYKTRAELVIEGTERLLPEEKLVGDEIQEKTAAEKLSEDLITREEWLDQEIRPQRDGLLREVDIVDCNAERWETYSDTEKQKWRDYKQALRDFPATVDPSNVVWPQRPATEVRDAKRQR